ncbi:MAG: hypothetical protein KC442_21675 [Thermomicrobiales bacterium]|nr:hypothetical protein [Thermomicrobiales bacterium]
MDGHQFDDLLRRMATSRRTIVGGVLAAAAGLPDWPDAAAKKRRKRKRKCKSPKVKCGKKCLSAGSCCKDADCGLCQVCSGKTCVTAPAGAACGVGGECNGTSCVKEGTFGCTPDQNFCDESPRTPCPRSTTPGAICIVNGAGRTVCAVGGCIFGDTPQACEAAFGPGAVLQGFCSPCALGGPLDPRNGCFRPVTQ